MAETNRKENLDKIIAIEMEMFTSMKTDEPIPEDTLPAFKRMRWMTYSVLSDATLEAWRKNLEQAKADGRNTMVEKYLMIAGEMPVPGETDECCCLRISPELQGMKQKICADEDICEIVEIENRWQEETARKYPKSVQRQADNGESFMHYLMCELHTWAPATVRLYHQDVKRAVANGRNLAEERYDNLYASIGKGSLHELEASLE
ncbi:MAG: DUF4125 family protein [Acidaminococcaceae bacterium]